MTDAELAAHLAEVAGRPRTEGRGAGGGRRPARPGFGPPPPAKLRMVVSRTRPAREATEVAATLGAELVPMGSAGAKAMAIVRGEADIYLHSGGQYEWDSCAPAA